MTIKTKHCPIDISSTRRQVGDIVYPFKQDLYADAVVIIVIIVVIIIIFIVIIIVIIGNVLDTTGIEPADGRQTVEPPDPWLYRHKN